MKLTSYIHPISTFLPCSGVGRHINAILLEISRRDNIDLELLFSNQWLVDKRLPDNCPLNQITYKSFPFPEILIERMWKVTGYPRMNGYIADHTDWVYCPDSTRIPVTRCPVAITIHDIQAFETGLPWSNTREHRMFRRKWSTWIYKAIQESRIIFTVSEYSKWRIEKLLGVDTKKIHISGNAADDMYFEAYNHRKNVEKILTDSDPYVLIVGGLRLKKGADYIIRVAQHMKKANPELKFVVAGPNEQKFEDQAKLLGNFQLLGWTEDSSMPALMTNAVVLLFLSHYEGYGMPAIEAMACGTPVIVSNKASLPEIVGESGYVVEPDNIAEIHEIIHAMLSFPQQREDVGRKANQWASLTRWSDCADRVLQVMKDNG